MLLTTQQQYDNTRKTLVSWLNWQDKSDVGGLMLGLGDYWSELVLLEKELGLPKTRLADLLTW